MKGEHLWKYYSYQHCWSITRSYRLWCRNYTYVISTLSLSSDSMFRNHWDHLFVFIFEMALQYRKFIELKKVLIPLSIYILISTITIVIGPSLNSSYLKKGLSLFFILLSFYFLFIKKKNTQIKMSIFISLFCILISSICDGLFGIGGPLMVIYFKNKTDNQNEYLGCIQLFFLVNCIYNTILRIINDILLPQHLSIILISIPAICLGLLIAKKISYQLNINFINKITYLIIGLSGLFNLIA